MYPTDISPVSNGSFLSCSDEVKMNEISSSVQFWVWAYNNVQCYSYLYIIRKKIMLEMSICNMYLQETRASVTPPRRGSVWPSASTTCSSPPTGPQMWDVGAFQLITWYWVTERIENDIPLDLLDHQLEIE